MSGFFHLGFFKEKFRQLRTAGLVSAGVLALVTLSGVLIAYDSNYIPGASTLAGSLMTYAYVMGFVLTLSAFHWLNKRSQSDFYHSIPVSRRAMFCSTFAAIMLWLVIGVCAAAVIRAGLSLIGARPFNYLLYLCVIINVLISCLAIVAAVSLACALSGTRFVNWFAALVILFLPRILLSIFALFVRSCGNGLHIENISFLFDPSFNIAGTYPYAGTLFNFIDASIRYTEPAAMIYSFVYALVIAVCGCIAFVRRRSEDAGTPTTSKLLQTAVRSAFGLPLLLILVGVINEDGLGYIGIALPILVLFAFVAYCLYELISTKSAKKMVKAMPLFVIPVAVALLYLVLPRLVAKAEHNIKVSTENVKSYSVVGDDYYEYGMLGRFLSDEGRTYSDLEQSRVKFTDERGKKIVSEAIMRADPDNYNNIGNNQVIVRVDRKAGKDLLRTVYLTDKELDEFSAILASNEEYNGARYEYPQGRLYYNCEPLDPASAAKIGRQFAEEYASLRPEQKDMIGTQSGWAESLIEVAYDYIEPETWQKEGSSSFGTLTISGCKGVNNYINSYSITNLTPKTAKLYVQLVNEKYYDKGVKMLDDWRAEIVDADTDGSSARYDSISYYNVAVSFDENSGDLYMNTWEMSTGELAEAYREILGIMLRGERAEDTENVLTVHCTNMDERAHFFIKLSPEDYARARELMDVLFEEYQKNNSDYWGSFFDGYMSSYDGKYYAYYEQMGSAVTLYVCDYETDSVVYSFSPARAVDFYGYCWEDDNYNIWIQSADIGVKCYKYEDGIWTLDEEAERPSYIKSIYD